MHREARVVVRQGYGVDRSGHFTRSSGVDPMQS